MGKKIKVKIDEQHVFNSLVDACKFLKANNVAGLAHALKHGNKTYNGHIVEQLPYEIIKKHKRKSKGCPVFCENNNITFKTITDAANYAQVDGWTMSKKMESSGQFIDSKGNIYKRLKPMKSKNIYKDTGSIIKKHVEFHNRTRKTKNIIPEITVKSESINMTKQDTNFNAKSFLKDKLISCIKSDNLTEAKAYIQVIESLKQ